MQYIKKIFISSDTVLISDNHSFNLLQDELDKQEKDVNICNTCEKNMLDSDVDNLFTQILLDEEVSSSNSNIYNKTVDDSKLLQIQDDIININSLMNSIKDEVYSQRSKIDFVDDHISKSSVVTEQAVEFLEVAEEYSNKYYFKKIKMASGAVLGCVLFGGVGSVYGVTQAVVASGVGTGTGAFTGWLL